MSHDDPSELTLETIRQWPLSPLGLPVEGVGPNWVGLLEYMERAWITDYGVVRRPPPVKDEPKRWEFVTGGWSGNELIMGAFFDNLVAYAMMWKSSHRGGLHVLEEPKP